MNNKKSRNKGAAFLFIMFGLFFCVVFVRFLIIQYTGVAGGEELAAKAQDKYQVSRTLTAERGSIVDTKGEVLARDTSSYKLIAILDDSLTEDEDKPHHVVDKEKTARILAEHINMEESEILAKLQKKNVYQTEFGSAGRDLSHQTKLAIEELELPGITFIKDTKRFYPNGVFSSHVIGFVEEDENTGKVTGALGVERMLDKHLQEEDGSITFQGDLWRNILPNKQTEVQEPSDGATVQLTLDSKIQIFLEDAMSQVNDEYNPVKMIGIVADPDTGKILAMSQRPTYDLNTRKGLEKTWQNLAVEESYEPGSTMKVFTLATAIEEGVWNPNELYKSGTYKIDKSTTIGDHNGKRGWGTISYLEGVQRSSNVAFAKLAVEKIGSDTLLEYLKEFGFGKKTGIDLPHETTGQFAYKWESEKVTTAYGQGTTVTPIQLIQAATAIANDGKMMKPYVVEKITDSSTGKTIKETKPTVVAKPISSKSASEVRNILETVVTSEKGTGKPYKIDGYDVIGKTGTASIYSSEKGGYLTGHNNYIFSFLGAAPKDDPEVVVYIAVQQPQLKGNESGSAPVSKVFNSVMENTLKYLNIESEETDTKTFVEVPDVVGTNIELAKMQVEKTGLTPVVIGNGTKIKKQSPSGTSVIEGEKILLLTDGKLTMPDFTGWSLRNVMKASSLMGVDLNTSGSGYVSSQKPKPGTVLKENQSIVVQFEDPETIYEKSKKDEADEEEEEIEEIEGG